MENLIQDIRSTVKNWWIFLIIGILFIISAISVFSTPLESFLFLSVLFSMITLFDGIGNVMFAISNRKTLKSWGWTLVSGIVGTIFGLGLVMYPSIPMTLLPLFFGFWTLYRGGTMIGSSMELRSMGASNWGWLTLLGVLTCLLGLAIVINPLFGVASIIICTALGLIFLGAGSIFFSLQLKKLTLGGEDATAHAEEKLNEINKLIQEFSDRNYASRSEEEVHTFFKKLREEVQKGIEAPKQIEQEAS